MKMVKKREAKADPNDNSITYSLPGTASFVQLNGKNTVVIFLQFMTSFVAIKSTKMTILFTILRH